MNKMVLVIDDNQIDRDIIKEMLSEEYVIKEAESGNKAISIINDLRTSISVILLDLVMPDGSGFNVLEALNKEKLIDKIPVLIISGEKNAEVTKRCFEMGVVDFVGKPFDEMLLKARVNTSVSLFEYKRELEAKVLKQMETLKKQNKLLIIQSERLKISNDKMSAVLGTIVEYRNVETKNDVRRICEFAKIVAKEYKKLYPDEGLTDEKIEIISSASVLHDLGKLSIPDTILLKPGRLTEDEFEFMKSHTLKGAELVAKIDGVWGDDYKKCCMDICKFHHEKYDGEGYPFGVSGDQIPLSAQIVGIVDVYDALISEKIYKRAYPLDKAYNMIISGETGMYSPKLMEAFRRSREKLENIASKYQVTEAAETVDPSL